MTRSAGEPLELTGHIFGRFFYIPLIALLGIAAWYGHTAVATLLGLTLSTIGISMAWSRLALRRVHCERTLSTKSLFPGEELTLTLRLVNAKALPLPWVEVNQVLPSRLTAQDGEPSSLEGVLQRTASLPWYSRITWHERVRAERRGFYVIPPLTVTSGDVLGLYPRQRSDAPEETVVVYPHIYPVHHLSLPRTDASGDLLGKVSLQEDPTRMRGIREYQPQDGLRRVHWKATAHHGELMVKICEPAAISRLNLVLVADGFGQLTDEDPFELAVSAIASAANYCVAHQMQVGLIGNARLTDGGGESRVPPGSGDRHLITMLEILARATTAVSRPFPVLARHLRSLATSGAGLVIVTGRLQDMHIGELAALARTGASLLVLEVRQGRDSAEFPFSRRVIEGPADLLKLEAD
ncbi:MAG: DUF58 domain-containing protein [Dehalococcoidia bacterium]|nr:DUF58 domain-containing protein [Dehalococcoidia bacterium]